MSSFSQTEFERALNFFRGAGYIDFKHVRLVVPAGPKFQERAFLQMRSQLGQALAEQVYISTNRVIHDAYGQDTIEYMMSQGCLSERFFKEYDKCSQDYGFF